MPADHNPLAGTVYVAPTKPDKCLQCGKGGKSECGRVECARRERLTADVPGGLVEGRVKPRFF